MDLKFLRNFAKGVELVPAVQTAGGQVDPKETGHIYFSDRDSVEAGRRRKDADGPSGRAERPSRPGFGGGAPRPTSQPGAGTGYIPGTDDSTSDAPGYTPSSGSGGGGGFPSGGGGWGGSSGGGGSYPTGSSGGGGGLPTGGLPLGSLLGLLKSLPLWVIILAVVCCVGYFLLNKGGSGLIPGMDTGGPVAPQPTEAIVNPPANNTGGTTGSDGWGLPMFQPTPELAIPQAVSNEPVPTLPPFSLAPQVNAKTGQTWTIMLYQDADDPTLEQDIYMDLNEAEQIGSSANVNVVAQMDRYNGGFAGDGDWHGTRRYKLEQDPDLFRVNSPVVQDLGEVNMADPRTLYDFAVWAIKTYPADHYVLVMSDHGMGWPGGFTDPNPNTRSGVNTAFSQVVKSNMMYTNDFDVALANIVKDTGIGSFDIVGMDACLMSEVEVMSSLAPYSQYLVGSEEVEPALGWAYASFLAQLTANPSMSAEDLAKIIVDGYIKDDQRINNPQARADFLRQGSPLQTLFGAPQDVDPASLSRQLSRSITLTAAKTAEFPALMDALNTFAFALQKDDQNLPAQARTYAQGYTSIFGEKLPPSYIDLGNFAAIVGQNTNNAEVQAAANALIAQIGKVVVAEKHGPEKPGSTGISIYYPNSQLYSNAVAGARSYAQISTRFAQESVWDDFLAFHYTGRQFAAADRSVTIPEVGTRVTAPGQGTLTAIPLQLSANSVTIDESIRMSTTITGKNVGYVYLFVGFHDKASNSIFVADQDYLESPDTKRVGDLFYPSWSRMETFDLSYEWKPTVFGINDGTKVVTALLSPEQYGSQAENAVYTTDGYLSVKATGTTSYARLYFSNGKLTRVVAYMGDTATGPMHDMTPAAGDTFQLIENWMQATSSGAYETVKEKGEILTFGDKSWTWEEQYAAAGDYVLGFVITDLDGRQVQIFQQATVK